MAQTMAETVAVRMRYPIVVSLVILSLYSMAKADDYCTAYAKSVSLRPDTGQQATDLAQMLRDDNPESIFLDVFLFKTGLGHDFQPLSPETIRTAKPDPEAYERCERISKRQKEMAREEKEAEKRRVKQQEVDAAYKRCDDLPYQKNINKRYRECLASADEYAISVGIKPRRDR